MNPSSKENQYYHSQGLERDPFPIDAVDDIFFISPEIRHRLELIKHLIEFSNQLLVITAAPGYGKSALYRYIASSADTNWVVSRIQAKAGIVPLDLAMAIVRDGTTDQSRQPSQSVKGLNKYLGSCYRNHKLPVVLIDDADSLSVDALEYITKLLELNHEGTRLRILLFAQEAIVKKLNDPMIKAGSSGILHTINIQPLDLEQTGDYLQYRFFACGKRVESPFTKKDFRQIYRVSGGIPGKINHLARQVLRDPAMFMESSNKDFVNRTFPIIIAVVVVLIIAAYVISGDMHKPEETGETSLTLPDQSGPPEISEQAPVTPAVQSAADEEQVTVIEEDEHEHEKELLPLLDSEAVPVGVEKLIPGLDLGRSTRKESKSKAAEKNIRIGSTQETIAVEASEQTIQQTPSAEERDPAAGSRAVPGPEAEESIIAGVKGAEWLRRQLPERYVLQLIGANERNTLLNLLREQTLDRDKLAVFTTHKDGSKWYVLVYGLYPDRNAALAAIPSLPANIREQTPWGRSIASIQSDINAAP